MANKKDGTWRMCVNYKGLNKLTIRNSYPLPRSDHLIDRLQSARYFINIDLHTGYHQIRVSEEDVSKQLSELVMVIMSFGFYHLG